MERYRATIVRKDNYYTRVCSKENHERKNFVIIVQFFQVSYLRDPLYGSFKLLITFSFCKFAVPNADAKQHYEKKIVERKCERKG